ncbi:MAG TPA: glycosyltransferase family 2 protein [Polyangiaceae bacterium]|nr:glycosyltransferase family 2 protein [Polyangiaceae bacterium]
MTRVSAIVCTRNRPEPVARVVRSLLLSPEEDLELLVVDQSDGPDTENALRSLLSDTRLRYYRSKARGKGAALNEGIRASRGEIIVCTDDDCEAPPGWVVGMARALQSQPSAVVAFCSVIPVPHDKSAGYVPAYELTKNRLLRSVGEICQGLGIGAGMALRRDFAMSMGGFDEAFGPGARFPSADEWDIAMRALLTGHHVFETADLAIVHDGFRTFQEGRAHARRDWIALGAVCAKPLRALHLRAAIVPLWLFSTRAVWPPVADVLNLRKPRGLMRIVAFLEGFGRGLCIAVDPATLRYN